MEKAKYSAFDLFGYALPGIFLILVCFVLFNEKIERLSDITEAVSRFNLNQAILLLIFGYIIGFTFYRLGVSLRRLFEKRFWKDRDRYSYLDIPQTERLILVRENTPENYRYIQTWFLISGMSANLALGSVALMITAIVKLIQFGGNFAIEWSGMIILGLLMSYFLIEKSNVYAKWASRELNQSIITFGLADHEKQESSLF